MIAPGERVSWRPIFAGTGRTWDLAAPTLPAAMSLERVTVLRLISTANQAVALLAVGAGHTASLIAAWWADNGRQWTLSPALPTSGAPPASASFGVEGTVAVITTGGGAGVITSRRGTHWQALPALPPGTATLAPGRGRTFDALTVHGATLAVWQLSPGGTAWTQAQTINVPIQYGSSG